MRKSINKKILSIGVFIIIIAALIFSGYFLLKPYYQSWKIGYDWKRFENEFNKFLKEDKYGGKTPQETYNLFVETLKKGDIESASQYFYWERQEIKRQEFQKLKDENKLNEYIDNLPKWEELKEEEEYKVEGEKRYSYKYKIEKDENFYDPLLEKERTIPVGEYQSWIIFQLNKQANIWKIYSL